MSETQTTLREQISAAADAVEAPETEAVVETPKETQPEKPAAETKVDQTGRLHAKDGKFAEKKEEKTDEPTPAVPAISRPPRPSSWKKDYEKDWETLDPRLAAYIDQREKEYAKGVSTYKQEWERAKPLLEAIAPFQQQFQQYGVSPDQWVRSLGAAHQALALGSPQQKLQMFAKLAQDYGVPLQALLQPQQGQQVNPQFAMQQALQQAIAPIRQEFQQYKTQQEQREAAQLQKEIEAFASDEHPHFEAVKETMAGLLEKGLASTLDDAYSISLRMPQHDDIWSAMQEEKRKAEEAERRKAEAAKVEAAKKKAVSLKSSAPGPAANATGKTSALREQYAELVEGSAGRV
jgi:hypothetical protein